MTELITFLKNLANSEFKDKIEFYFLEDGDYKVSDLDNKIQAYYDALRSLDLLSVSPLRDPSNIFFKLYSRSNMFCNLPSEIVNRVLYLKQISDQSSKTGTKTIYQLSSQLEDVFNAIYKNVLNKIKTSKIQDMSSFEKFIYMLLTAPNSLEINYEFKNIKEEFKEYRIYPKTDLILCSLTHNEKYVVEIKPYFYITKNKGKAIFSSMLQVTSYYLQLLEQEIRINNSYSSTYRNFGFIIFIDKNNVDNFLFVVFKIGTFLIEYFFRLIDILIDTYFIEHSMIK